MILQVWCLWKVSVHIPSGHHLYNILILSKSLLCCLPTDTPEPVLQNSRKRRRGTDGMLDSLPPDPISGRTRSNKRNKWRPTEPTELNIYSVSFHLQFLFNTNHSITQLHIPCMNSPFLFTEIASCVSFYHQTIQVNWWCHAYTGITCYIHGENRMENPARRSRRSVIICGLLAAELAEDWFQGLSQGWWLYVGYWLQNWLRIGSKV